MRTVAWKIKVTAERQLWQWQGEPMWTGSAEVHVRDGVAARRNFFAFGGNPQPTRKEALRFAYLAALTRLRAEYGRNLALHAGGVGEAGIPADASARIASPDTTEDSSWRPL